MGYCIDFMDANFCIPADRVEDARKAALALVDNDDNMTGGTFSQGKTTRFYAWMDDTRFMAGDQTMTLAEILSEWEYEPSMGVDGSIDGIRWFDGEKIGDEDCLWDALAPYVEAGSWIQMSGEDGTIWRWVFDGNTCGYQTAMIVFPDPSSS